MKSISRLFWTIERTRGARFYFSSSCVEAVQVGGKRLPDDGLHLADFMGSEQDQEIVKGIKADINTENGRKYFIETYGCQMNVNDSEVVGTILQQGGYSAANNVDEADVVLLNTCAIRENAESKIWQRLGYFKNLKRSRMTRLHPQSDHTPVIGVLGCMAERLKQRLLESDKLVDMVVGPDAYRDLPRLIDVVAPFKKPGERQTAMNVQLSLEETYADIIPVRDAGNKSVFLSIMRGCNNMCSFCVVPFTRGRERSRPMKSILDEVKYLRDAGTKEVTLLGQNVNSYSDFQDPEGNKSVDRSKNYFEENYARGFVSVYKPIRDGSKSFADLLHEVASIDPEMRIRFTSPHPKDFSNNVLDAIKSHDNICKQLHMPAQSGSSTVLERMKRGYSREAYNALVDHIRSEIPGVALSTDMISGFCGESEEEHLMSVDLMRSVKYDLAFLFAYSIRDKTHAARHYQDDVQEEVKVRRLQELIFEYRSGLEDIAKSEIGRRHIVLVEGKSRKSEMQLTGRTDTFKRVIFDDEKVPSTYQLDHSDNTDFVRLNAGDYVAVQIIPGGKGATLHGKALGRTTINEFVNIHKTTLPLNLYLK